MENEGKNNSHVSESSFFKRFLKKAEEYVKQPLRVKELLNDAYTKASEKKDIGTIAGEVIESLGTLIRLIKAAVSKDYHGIPTSTIVMAVAVIIYFLSPIDVIPDWIPVIGFLDDAALLAWFMTNIKEEMDRFLVWEKANPTRQTEAENATTMSASVDPSSQTPKYENEATGQYGTPRVTAPSSSGIGSSAESGYASPEGGNMHVGHQSSGAQGSTGGIIPSQTNTTPVSHFDTVEGTPAHEQNPTATADAQPTDKGVPTGYGEPIVRASTTDSTRVPSSNSHDTDHGGNVR